MNRPDTNKLHAAARQLYTGRFRAVLSTHSVEAVGYPFGSLIPFCLDREERPLLLLSHLAQHTRNLIANPRCSLTLVEPGSGDAQKRMRLTCIGDAVEADRGDEEPAERYFRYFPEKEDYYRELNFRFYHISSLRFYFIGGFGAARWLDTDRILRPRPFSREQESELLNTFNKRQPDALHPLLKQTATSPSPPADAPVFMTGIDADGVDLRWGDELYRLPLPGTVTTRDEAEKALKEMIQR